MPLNGALLVAALAAVAGRRTAIRIVGRPAAATQRPDAALVPQCTLTCRAAADLLLLPPSSGAVTPSVGETQFASLRTGSAAVCDGTFRAIMKQEDCAQGGCNSGCVDRKSGAFALMRHGRCPAGCCEPVATIEDCLTAAQELGITNLSAHTRAPYECEAAHGRQCREWPVGCFLDNQHSVLWWNEAGVDHCTYTTLGSLCRCDGAVIAREDAASAVLLRSLEVVGRHPMSSAVVMNVTLTGEPRGSEPTPHRAPPPLQSTPGAGAPLTPPPRSFPLPHAAQGCPASAHTRPGVYVAPADLADGQVVLRPGVQTKVRVVFAAVAEDARCSAAVCRALSAMVTTVRSRTSKAGTADSQLSIVSNMFHVLEC